MKRQKGYLMLSIRDIEIPGFHRVVEGIDSELGLHCIIAIHDITLGPALGGLRIYDYPSREHALNDALRLAKAMTYKSAVAKVGMGGGKSVLIGKPGKVKTPAILHAYAAVLDTLKGEFIVGADVGVNSEDMLIIHQKTPYVVGFPKEKSNGDPSAFGAWGVFRGMQAVAQHLWHSNSLRRKKILIQGLGNLGSKLANLLYWEGADLIVTEKDDGKLHDHVLLYGSQIANAQEFYRVPCDIFAPCALGEVINPDTIDHLQCKAIAGSANNPLLDQEMGDQLHKKGIVYAPDYIINAGGAISAAAEFDPGGFNPKIVRDKVNDIYDILLTILEKSKKDNKPTLKIANEIAEYNLKNLIGTRKAPIIW
jgi:leucine dehydrogenase